MLRIDPIGNSVLTTRATPPLRPGDARSADAALELRQAQTCLRDVTAGALAEHVDKEEAAFSQNCVPSEAAS